MVHINFILADPPTTMPQQSKILNSRDEWKNKAIERAAELRELKKTQKRHLEKIAELKRNNGQLELLVEEKKQYLSSISQH